MSADPQSYRPIDPKTDPKALASPIVVTSGDPAGVGMDIALIALSQKTTERPWLIVGCFAAFCARFDRLCKKGAVSPAADPRLWPRLTESEALDQSDFCARFAKSPVAIVDTPCFAAPTPGKPNCANAAMVLRQLQLAHRLACSKRAAAIVTLPLAKSTMIEGGARLPDGSLFCGHTEYFAQACAVKKPVMMLANDAMRVALVTTHMPLRQVADAISAEAVERTVRTTREALRLDFACPAPTILVCGLNPHAGEGGHLGDEEIAIVNPVLRRLQGEGMDVSLALPADTAFTAPFLQKADAIVAMYHDQGLGPLKSHGFGKTANITLGLPYIRASVDHGTAFALAGTGDVDCGSFLYAVACAEAMSARRAQQK